MNYSHRLAGRSAVVMLGIATLGVVAPTGSRATSVPHSTTTTFELTGAEQTFTVPPTITSVHVEAIGGAGGPALTNLGSTSGPGGFGAHLSADVAVTPGETLYVEVGGDGAPGSGGKGAGAGGFNGGNGGGSSTANGGGGGGGSSDVRTVPSSEGADSLVSRVVVAGGGGGGAYPASDGGNAAAAGLPDCAGCAGGGPGTANEGGAGGAGNGGTGSFLNGGPGGSGGAGYGGGGGGGGWYGGGGGGGGTSGGGGGGSNYFGTGATHGSVSTDTLGVPSVSITYTPLVAAHITLKVSHHPHVIAFHGTAKPVASGKKVSVALFRKKHGTFHPVTGMRVTLNGKGKFHGSFDRPKPGRCAIEAEYRYHYSGQTAGADVGKKIRC